MEYLHPPSTSDQNDSDDDDDDDDVDVDDDDYKAQKTQPIISGSTSLSA